MAYSPYSKPSHRRSTRYYKRHSHRLLIFAFVLLGVYLVLPHFFSQGSDVTLGKKTNALQTTVSDSDWEHLEAKFDALAQEHSDIDIGIVAQDLSTGKQATLNPDLQFFAASTAKIITALTYYHQAQEGSVNLDQAMGAATIAWQLHQMINQSNNDSWQLLNGQIPLTTQQEYAVTLGATHSNFPQTITTPADLTSILGKLYSGSILNTTFTQAILTDMQNTNEEGYIPRALPAGITAYHKYGMLDNYVHDTAILIQGSHAVVLTIMSRGSSPDYDDRAELFHEITKNVTDALFS